MANALQKIITTAKTLQRKNKNLSWKDAIKKASAMYRANNKPAAKKKAAKKKSVGKKPSIAKKSALSRSSAKKGKKIKARKKSAPRAKHIDTKSHNVNVRVISGVMSKSVVLDKLRELAADLDAFSSGLKVSKEKEKQLRAEKNYLALRDRMADTKFYADGLKQTKIMIKTLKKHL